MNNPTRLLILTALVAGISGYAVTALAQGKNMPKGIVRTVAVHTDLVQLHEVAQSIGLIGKLQSTQFISLAPQVAGQVAEIKVLANQLVRKGQLLVQLDDVKAQAALAEAQAYYADEQRKLNEFSVLVKNNAISKTEVLAQRAQVAIAKARLNAVQADADDHYLLAPFAGTVGLIDFSRGKMVAVGSELLTLDDLSQMDLDLQVPERYLAQLTVGMPVTATSQAWPGQNFIGKVTAIDSRINPETLNLRVRVVFANALQQLKPGMMMSANMVFPAIEAAIIPVQALEYSGSKRFVYVVDGVNQTERREVILGARIQDQVLIEKGLSVGERIVVQGLVNMRDGLQVKDLANAGTR